MVEENILCVVAPALVNNGRYSLSQEELCRVPLVARERGSGTQQAVYDALSTTWIRRDSLRIVAVLDSNEALKRAVIAEAGYAFVSAMSVAEEIANGQLSAVRIPGVAIKRRFFAVSRAGRALSPAATAFQAMMIARWR